MSSSSSGTMSAVFFLFLMFPLISAQAVVWGPCLTPSVKANFNVPLYMGKWYEIMKIPAYFAPGKCLEVDYKQVKPNTIYAFFSQTYRGKVIKGGCSATVPVKDERAKLGISFSHFNLYHPYWVLDTDYFSYAIVYSCSNVFNIFNYQYAWIIGRKRSLSSETLRKAKELLKKEGIWVSRMKATDQSCGDH